MRTGAECSRSNSSNVVGCVLVRGADESIKPGVKRSGTPGSVAHEFQARGTGGSLNAYKHVTSTSSSRIFVSQKIAVAHFVGSVSYPPLSWGFAALHPRLYAFARYRGLNRKTTKLDYVLRVSFGLNYLSLRPLR